MTNINVCVHCEEDHENVYLCDDCDAMYCDELSSCEECGCDSIRIVSRRDMDM